MTLALLAGSELLFSILVLQEASALKKQLRPGSFFISFHPHLCRCLANLCQTSSSAVIRIPYFFKISLAFLISELICFQNNPIRGESLYICAIPR